MKLIVKNTLISMLTTMLLISMANAFDLDETVNDEIRKNYNDNKLIEDTGLNHKITTFGTDEELPDLPNITKNKKTANSPDVKTSFEKAPSIPPAIPYKRGNIRVKRGTSFEVKNTTTISDWQKKGTTINFKSSIPVKGIGYTIPTGTTFVGEIKESHQPQITCNGGLVTIKIYSMVYKGQYVPINAYITKVNGKKIFFNDIKGERTYLKTMWKKGNWGRSLFNRMCSLTVNLGSSNSTLILSPFPFVYGTLCFGANTLISPITAFFTKGGHVSISSGSKFTIKLIDEIYID